MEKKYTPKGDKSFTLNILPNVRPLCKVSHKSSVNLKSELRLNLMTVLQRGKVPFAVTLTELALAIGEPVGRTQSALCALRRFSLISYEYMPGPNFYIISRVSEGGSCIE